MQRLQNTVPIHSLIKMRVILSRQLFLENILVFLALLAFGFYVLNKLNSGNTGPDWFPFVTFVLYAVFFFLFKIFLGELLSFNRVTIPSFFMLIYFLLTPYGVVENYFSLDNEIKEVYLLAMLSPMITFPLGVGLASLFNYSRSGVLISFTNEISSNSLLDKAFATKAFKIVLFLLIPFLFFLLSFYDRIPLIDFFSGIGVLESRLSVSDDVPKGIQFLFEILRRAILPFITIFFFMFSTNDGKYKKKFYFMLIISMATSILTLDRAPIVALLVMLALSSLVMNRNSLAGSVFSLKFFFFVIVALLLGGIVGILQYQEIFNYPDLIRSTMHVLLDRIMLDSTNMALISFETYNNNTHFLYGENIRALSIFPGFDYVPSTGQGSDSPVAPVGFIADLWRNFSWFGVVLAPIFMGFFYQFIQLVIYIRKSQLLLSTYIVMIIGSISVFHGSVFGVMSISTVLIALFFSLLIKKNYL